MKVLVGSRGSKLALTQTNWVIEKIKECNPEIDFEVKIIKTKGDRITDVALDKIGDKGLFVKEIESELLNGDIDIAIHSMKDMPSSLPDGLKFAGIPKREDSRDVLILREGVRSLEDVPKGGRIGTGSKRRKYQLLELRPDLDIVPIRGNIDTRIKKIDEMNLHGIVLAAAGVKRMNLTHRISAYLEKEHMLSAPAQGALAIEIRKDDENIEKMVNKIRDEISEIQIRAERAFLQGVNGSCHIPIGAFCEVQGNQITLYGMLGKEDGSNIVKQSISGESYEAAKLGGKLAELILEELNEYEG